MTLAFLLALQAAPAVPEATLEVEFDLASVPSAGGCAPGGSDDIIVCGRRPGGDYPLAKWERVFRSGPLVAETGIGGGAKLRAYGESAALPGGHVSKRAMVGIRLGF